MVEGRVSRSRQRLQHPRSFFFAHTFCVQVKLTDGVAHEVRFDSTSDLRCLPGDYIKLTSGTLDNETTGERWSVDLYAERPIA